MPEIFKISRRTRYLLSALTLSTCLVKLVSAETQISSVNTAPPQPASSSTQLTQASTQAATPLLAIDANRYTTETFDWIDSARNRIVPVRLYLPGGSQANEKKPLVIFSHGIGGSRDGYSYLGRFFAANGYASLHVQHVGSDRQLWRGNPFGLVARLSNAAKDTEAIDRARDLSFALDQLSQHEISGQIDLARIVAAGHSYGANTAMLISGAAAESQGKIVSLRDKRIKAAILISAPPFYGAKDIQKILSPVTIPTLHITATGDEIQIPGYRSGVSDRIDVYRAIGQTPNPKKALVIFKDGSHSIFTDRLGTGGIALNPLVKVATRSLALAFLNDLENDGLQAMNQWQRENGALLSSFEQALAP